MSDKTPRRKGHKTPLQHELGELLENAASPEIYATSTPFFATALGVLTITLVSSRVDNSLDPPIRRQVVVGRISMPLAAAANLATGLYTFLAQHGYQFTTPEEKERVQ